MTHQKSYAQAIQFLSGLQVFGVNFGLETTRRLAALVGNPQNQLRFIHVAGTNGKGSTCAMLDSIYRAAGLRVGLYTSPHLVSFRERIQVNGQLIPQADVARLVAGLASGSGEPGTDARPTFFEFVTVLALKYFAEQKCDLVIWETGLGGRLDATNIVTPLAGVITNIGLDHQQWLGDTVEKIAAEKAGIIKPGVPVIAAAGQDSVLNVIKQVADQNRSPLSVVRTSAVAQPVPLLGKHQQLNASVALAAVEVLQKQIPVSPQQVSSGLAQVRWPGRLQRLIRPDGQTVLLDGAHNIAGVETLCEVLVESPGKGSFTLILGMLNDKDWQSMCRMLAPLAARVLTVPVNSGRTAIPARLAAACHEANPSADVISCASFSDALTHCKKDKNVVIAGSLYLIGEALAILDPQFKDVADERALNEWTTAGAGSNRH